MTDQQQEPQLDENEQIAQRKAKLAEIRRQGVAFPNDFRPEHHAIDLTAEFDAKSKEELEELARPVKVSGRIMLRRIMGKASFLHIQDSTARLQVYLRRDDLPEGQYQEFKNWDLGDIVAVEGVMFKTNKGELSVKANNLRLLTKALRPLPDKHHGLAEVETRYRQRYLDLIVNDESRNAFTIRSKVVSSIRRFLTERNYMEVETPMLQVIPGGASARPFVTHHNSLDLDMYLRIAPELYLKRLVVGGFERVFEINRNFRNEGLSTRHNPEFTMLEFYQAHADYHDLMDLTEKMLRTVAQEVLGQTTVPYQGEVYDFGQPFARMSMIDSILHYNSDVSREDLETLDGAKAVAERKGAQLKGHEGRGKVITEIFEATVEEQLRQPTFITEYPAEVSPLARLNDEDSFITDRFEFFCGGREVANGFSELNDPEDQAERFKRQVEEKDAGDDEAMHYDADYITALEHGMPPTAGEGIGIDRLVMLFTDSPSIRDVILFPHMRPQAK
ncbi:lysine--tRNA ligase [Piscirickettsia litoralis]|uniref:Lysine--tRNA ligase n=1 Tax=Piscirickettsia litoralis TaxID=1891921 RepID=A0ABX3A579_9GAMM|nr:lysine--tRNA ligase [Piscirickettsia litoralis]ODN43387.1 lysine--tRNA ligase [Piscirickettsia litoralis]